MAVSNGIDLSKYKKIDAKKGKKSLKKHFRLQKMAESHGEPLFRRKGGDFVGSSS